MSSKSRVLRRFVNLTLQKEGLQAGRVPRIGNALLKTVYEGTITSGGPPRVTISPSLGVMAWRGLPCASSLGQPAPDKIIVEYNSQSTDDFIALADSIEEAHSDIVVEGVEIETDPGNFIVKDSEGQILDQGNTEKITTQRVLEVLESLGLSQGNSSQNAQDCVL